MLVTLVSNSIAAAPLLGTDILIADADSAAAPVDYGPGLPAVKTEIVRGSAGKSGGLPASVAPLSGDPAAHIKGVFGAAFAVLDNVTHTDLFCGAQLVLPNSVEVILMGGDRTDIYGRRNNGNSDINYYSPTTNTIRKDAQGMGWGRW